MEVFDRVPSVTQVNVDNIALPTCYQLTDVQYSGRPFLVCCDMVASQTMGVALARSSALDAIEHAITSKSDRPFLCNQTLDFVPFMPVYKDGQLVHMQSELLAYIADVYDIKVILSPVVTTEPPADSTEEEVVQGNYIGVSVWQWEVLCAMLTTR
jgi:hypothetical protein